MEKTLTIDGKQIRFKSTAGVAYRFKNQFQKDYLVELYKAIPEIQSLIKIDTEKMSIKDLQKINNERFLEIVWALAKTANPNIPEPLTWMDEFEEFPVVKVFMDLYDLIMNTTGSKKK